MAAPTIQVVVTPRFEIFYALQALESGAGEHLRDWRRDMETRLPARLRTSLASIAPTPLMWPLIADALRESPPAVTFPEMINALTAMDSRTFQTFVLGGVFKTPGLVDDLVSGRTTLARTVATEAKSQEKLLSLLGLFPFARQQSGPDAFEKLVRNPASYRDEVVNVLEAFWTHGFGETWQRLESEMSNSARELRRYTNPKAFAAFARANKLPVGIEGDTLVTVRGATSTPVKAATGVVLIPSAFNAARLWATYSDARGRTRFFLPVLDAGLPAAIASTIDPGAIFRALGDTTRYAIAAAIARTPMTSVELARMFGVSKPTISHHVQLMRSAKLIEDTQTENGVVLALNRRVLERASAAAAREMFSEDNSMPVVRRTRKANK